MGGRKGGGGEIDRPRQLFILPVPFAPSMCLETIFLQGQRPVCPSVHLITTYSSNPTTSPR